MTDLPPYAVEAGVALLAILLSVFVWRAVSDLPLLGRVLARLVLLAIVVAPLALFVSLGGAPMREAARPPQAEAPKPVPEEASREGGGRFGTAERPRSELEGRKRSAAPPRPAEPEAQPAPTSPRDAAPPSGGSAPPDVAIESVPPAGAPRAPESSDDATPAEWDVVPVFYGTDRAREAQAKRLSYSAERGRRLEIGQALVTVPRVHKVPLVERPWVIKIPYLDVTLYEESEDPARHFTIKEIRNLTREEMIALVRARLAASRAFANHALVFVHGYNTAFDHALYRTAQLAYDMKFDGASFLYSWPSGGKIASYTYDRESAGQSEPFLREFLELVVKQTGASSVSIIAHSMGNQPVLQVLRDLKRAAPPGVAINQVILAAPDVDRDNFENLTATIQDLAKGITLYAASNDRALIVSRRFHGGIPRAGDVPEQGPLVLPGVDTIDVTAASTDSLGLNHSGYAENNTLLNDVALLLQTGERPPDRRVPILEQQRTARGLYWRYPLSQ